MTETVAQYLVASLRNAAHAYAPGDQVAPCAVLWADPDRLWAGVVPALLPLLPELYQLGSYDHQLRSGPALWLRCIEARLVDGAPAAGITPILYLPGVSREQHGTDAGQRRAPEQRRVAQRAVGRRHRAAAGPVVPGAAPGRQAGRRALLRQAGTGFGAVAAAALRPASRARVGPTLASARHSSR
jgi:hypothetical protein